MSGRLTIKQKSTLDILKRKNYKDPKLNEVTSLVNAAFNKDQPDEIKKEVIKSAVAWFANNPQGAGKSKDEINELVLSKIKKLATNKADTTTKKMREEERKLFDEVKGQIDQTPFEGEPDPALQQVPVVFPGQQPQQQSRLVMTNQAQPPVPAEQDEAGRQPTAQDEIVRLQAEALARIAEQGQQQPAESESYLDVLGKYIDTGSQFYKDNKKTINKGLAALTPKKIQDGSYLTELAGLAAPEIEVFQKVIKAAGLGFSKEDSASFEKMLSRDPDVMAEVPYDEAIGLVFKMMLNPDQVGVLIKTRAGQIADDTKAWWKKITGQDRDLTPKEEDIRKKIDRRRKDIEDERYRKERIDEWMGDKKDEQFSPFPADGDGGIVLEPVDAPPEKGFGPGGAGIVPDPDGKAPTPDYSDMSAYDILIPPDDGFGGTTFGQDFMAVMRNIFSGGGIKIPTEKQNKEKYLEQLKRDHPAEYQQYQDAIATYTKTINKAKLERDGFVDYVASKDYVDNAKNLTQDLVKKAIERGDIGRDEASKIYDVWNLFDEVSTGKEKMTYAQMEQLQQQIFNALPRDIITQNSDAINEFMANNIDSLKPGWEGDSDLGSFDWLNDIIKGGEDAPDIDPTTGEPMDGKPKEKKIEPPKKQPPMVEPKYRYRGKWGDTDTLFKREEEEIQKRNLIIELGHLREQLDTTNQLIQSQMTTERRRFDRCFEMPTGQQFRNRALPPSFKKEHRAIFTPQYVNPMREPDRNFYMEPTYDYGQYQDWSDNVPQSSARSYLLKDPLVYPSNADIATGGESPLLAPARDYNYILNQRFVR